MSRQRVLAYVWLASMLVFFALVTWQEYPIMTANQNSPYKEVMRLQLAVMLKPGNLIAWAVLVAIGIVWTWKMRSLWRMQRGIFYVFLACSFSVCWFIVLLVFLR
jgi:hypothetical protein